MRGKGLWSGRGVSYGYQCTGRPPGCHPLCVLAARHHGPNPPIEVILPEARRRPRYRLINAPFKALQERGQSKVKPQVAELLLRKQAVA